MLTAYSGFVFLYIWHVCWRINETKHLLVNLLLYWSVVAILIPYASIVDKPLNELYVYGASDITTASWIGLTALLIYLTGIHLSIHSVISVAKETLVNIFNLYNGFKIIIAYLAVSIISVLVEKIILFVPGGQLLLTITYFKWVMLTFLIAHTLVIGTNRILVLMIVIVEILLSFSGFWAAFKDYIIVAIGAFLFFTPRLSFKSYIVLFCIFFITLFLSVVWTFSKGEYRKYLTGGERSQLVVQKDEIDNLNKFLDIVSTDFSSKNFKKSFSIGLENLIHRLSYVEFLALSMKHVPAHIPHQNGELMKTAFEHVFKPRFLFPEKKAIFDSELTSTYTGVQFASADQGTSFSLGTVAESYVDFGKVYMFVPILLFGIWIGWIYRYFIINGYNILWGLCFSAPIFQFAWSFQVPTSKFLGWSITYFIGFWFLNKYVIKYLDKLLLNK